ncbi:MAG: antibiotic biosynthesis monooxygenase [Gammaproteobacteria bacterium]|nr:antibiotic biosynthesis monooxygenase [Gammaproteobacteria bacterium]
MAKAVPVRLRPSAPYLLLSRKQTYETRNEALSKIILQGYILVSDGDLPEIQKELPLHIEQSMKEEGCLVFNVVQDDANKNIYHVYEEFIDSESFERHQKRVGSSRWGAATVDVERHYQITEHNQ